MSPLAKLVISSAGRSATTAGHTLGPSLESKTHYTRQAIDHDLNDTRSDA